MAHLSPDVLVALAEAPDRPRPLHLQECEACRHELAELEAVLAELRATAVEEPSPLFWDHFARRVHDALDQAPAAARWPLGGAWRWGWAVAALTVVVLVVGRLAIDGRWSGAPAADQSATGAVTTPVVPPVEAPLWDLAADDDWDVVTRLAASLADADVDALDEALWPGAAAPVIGGLTEDEQQELVRIIESELRLRSAS